MDDPGLLTPIKADSLRPEHWQSATIEYMVIQGHIQNGVVVPNGSISLPDGTEVTIVVRTLSQSSDGTMSPDVHQRYGEALANIDAVANENPGDSLSGADHDRVLYGE